MCWQPQTSGYSYLRVAAIRIDVHPASETWPTCHSHSMLGPHMALNHTYLTRSAYNILLHSHQQIWIDPLPREDGLLSQSMTRWLTNPWVRTQLLSHNSQWSSGEKPSFFWQPTTRLTWPISLTCDHYIQYLLVGANPSVLNRHKHELQPWRCCLSTSHCVTFPT
jgi:hypothetical protein